MIKNFSYFYDLYKNIYNKENLPIQNIFLAGSRKSGKTLSVIEFLVLLLMLNVTNVRMYVFRKNVQDIEQTVWEEVINLIENWELPVITNKMYRRITFNKNKITFHALHDRSKSKKVKLSGLASGNYFQYSISFFEECHEFTREDVEDVKEAIRGHSKRLYIFALNPWAQSHWLVRYCDTNMKFSENTLKKIGYQFLLKEKDFFHYSTYKVNEMLSEEDYEQLEEVKRINPIRARTACYGLPSIEKGAIYAHAIGKIRKYLDTDLILFQGGLDFGYARDATALILIAVNSGNEHVNIIDEYYHSNGESNIFKDNQTMARDIIDCIEKNANKYRLIYKSGITIYCDNSNYTMIELLNKMALSKNWFWLQFSPVKKIKVSLRVGLQLNIMEEERLNVNPKCVNFLREIEIARWDDSKGEKKPLDVDNHTQDAFHYAFIPWFHYLNEKSNKFLRVLI